MLKRSLPPSSFTAHPSCPASQVAQLPLTLSDGRWHHICITWTTRDGFWEAYQDGERLGTGDNLAPWHPIKPGGVIILGQEQVRKLRQPRVSMCALAPVCVCVCSPHGLHAGGTGRTGNQAPELFSRYGYVTGSLCPLRTGEQDH